MRLLTSKDYLKLGAQWMNLCASQGTVGQEAAMGIGAGQVSAHPQHPCLAPPATAQIPFACSPVRATTTPTC